MLPRKTSLFVSFLICISTSFHVGSSEPLVKTCSDNAVYNVSTTNGRSYRNNLETLLSTLYSNATAPTGFFNYTTGTDTAAIHGLFLCRGDVSPGECQSCLRNATTEVLQVCPNQTRANIFYDNCMLRYSNESIFSKLDTSTGWFLWNPSNFSDGALLNQVLGEAFDGIVNGAAHGDDPGKRFAVQEANYSSLQKIYALGQCTPDLSDLDCDSCLRKAIGDLPGCCSNRKGGRVLYPSCTIRYESDPFYQNPPAPPPTTTIAPSPPPVTTIAPPPPATIVPDSGSSQGDRGISTTIVAIIILLAVFQPLSST